MRKLFKKSLACILTAIICVSLCVVAVPASAATPTYSTNEVVAKAGETVSIDFTVSNFTDVQGAIIKFSLPSVVASVSEVKINGEALAPFDASTGNGYYEVNGTTIKFLSLFGLDGELDARDALTFNIKAVVSDTAEVGTYTYPAPEFQVAQGGAIVEVTGSFGKFEIIPTVVEPVLDTGLKFMSRSASIQDTLGIGYIVLKNTYSSKYAKIDIEVTATKYDSNRNKAVQAPVTIPVKAMTSTMDSAVYSGIAMYELGLPVTAMIKAYDAEGNFVAYSNTVTDSPAELVKTLYKNAKATETAKKTLVTDMLNLATEAQHYFAKDGSDLANEADLNKDWDQTYASAEVPSLALNSKITWESDSPLTSTQLTFAPALNFASTPTLGYVLSDKKSAFTKDDIKLEVSYTAVYPKSFAGERKQTIEGSSWTTIAGVMETATFSGMTLADSNQVITAVLYYKGQKVLTSEYTMDQGMSEKMTGNTAGLSAALAKFEASARAYFA